MPTELVGIFMRTPFIAMGTVVAGDIRIMMMDIKCISHNFLIPWRGMSMRQRDWNNIPGSVLQTTGYAPKQGGLKISIFGGQWLGDNIGNILYFTVAISADIPADQSPTG